MQCYGQAVPIIGGIGIWEIVLLAGLAVLLFGARRLPELGRTTGRSLREFRDSATGFRKPVDDAKDLAVIEEIRDIAALRSPRTALSRLLMDKPRKRETGTDT
jgi:sec-independent protein translocase protein TatA